MIIIKTSEASLIILHTMRSTSVEDSSIPLWNYSKERHQWLPKVYDRHQQRTELNGLRVITYNIWFSEKYQPVRFQNLCNILDRSQAGVIGLQEVSQSIVPQLTAQSFIRDRYFISDIDGRTFKTWYGVVMLIDKRLAVSNFNLINFPQSTMGRYLLLADIQFDRNEILRIGTTHLESLNNKHERKNQLQICQRAFNSSPASCMLLGDFNFNAEEHENIEQFQALPHWIDIWPYLKGNRDPGYTFDMKRNPMLRANSRGSRRTRIDRIILKSPTISPVRIDMLGTRPIGIEGEVELVPSDHFGLQTILSRRT